MSIAFEEDGGYFYETTPYAPHSPYSASKASSDMLVRSYMSSDIISLKQPALLLYHVDRLCMVLNIEPVPHIFAIAGDRLGAGDDVPGGHQADDPVVF